MSKLTEPKTPAEYIADLRAGQAKFPAAAESYQQHLREKNAEIARFRQDPSPYPPAAITKLIGERNSIQEAAEMLDAQQIDFLQRQYSERFFRENAEGLADALERDLAAVTVKLPERRKGFIAWLTSLPAKIYAPEMTAAERDALLEEREKRERTEEVLEENIRAAKAGIVRFRTEPLDANFGSVRGIIGIIAAS